MGPFLHFPWVFSSLVTFHFTTIQNMAKQATDLNSSHSQLSRAVLNIFWGQVLAENKHRGQGDHTLCHVYFYYASNEAGDNADWNFIERLQCTGGGRQTFITSYTLPKGSSQAVRVSMSRQISIPTRQKMKAVVGLGRLLIMMILHSLL